LRPRRAGVGAVVRLQPTERRVGAVRARPAHPWPARLRAGPGHCCPGRRLRGGDVGRAARLLGALPVHPGDQVTGAVAPGAATIELDRVSKWFGDLVAVSDVSLEVGPGVTALLGPNGAGKSTLLRVLCGLTPPSSGRVRILGRSPRGDVSLFRRIGLVPQQEAVFDAFTGLEFVAAAARLHRLDGWARRARQALELVEL